MTRPILDPLARRPLLSSIGKVVVVRNSAPVSSAHWGSPATSFLNPSSCWTKSLFGKWGSGTGCGFQVSNCSEYLRTEEGRHFEMDLTNRFSVRASSKVLATEDYGGEQGFSFHSKVDAGSNAMDTFVEEFGEIGETDLSVQAGEDVESAPSEDGFGQGVSSDSSSSDGCSDEQSTGGEKDKIFARKREFCKKCCKAASRCICGLIKSQVNNKTGIIILQHPLENNHHLGTARIAVVGLRNVELISVPENDEQISRRLRAKVPGSKRQIAGRGGKKAQFLAAQAEAKGKGPRKRPGEPKRQSEATVQVKQETEDQSVRAVAENQVVKMATLGTKHTEQDVNSIAIPCWINLQPNAGLLFPSEHAVDLRPVDAEFVSGASDLSDRSTRTSARRPPSQLIVLDGTWSKAKRIFYENPWLHSLPHYRLPSSDGASRYGIMRKEPKPGCMSTIESIVLALQTLEPETEGLHNLLHVFDIMIEDQKICMGEKYAELEEKVRTGLSQKSRSRK